jgi:hypothetical protein
MIVRPSLFATIDQPRGIPVAAGVPAARRATTVQPMVAIKSE